jgi:hypothetical protein
MNTLRTHSLNLLGLAGLLLAGTAQATSWTIRDVNSAGGDCHALGGFWDPADTTCRIGSLTIAAGDTLELERVTSSEVRLLIQMALDNQGEIIVNHDTNLSNFGTLTNDGVITNRQGGTIYLDGASVNGGGIHNEGNFTNAGTLTNTPAGEIVNTCDVSIMPVGSTCDEDAGFQNDDTLINEGLVLNSGNGFFTNADWFSNRNDGLFRNWGGVFTNLSDAVFYNGDEVAHTRGVMEIRTGTFLNQGEIVLVEDSELINDDTFINDDSNGLPLDMNGKLSLSHTAYVENNHFLENRDGGWIEIIGEAELRNNHHVYNDTRSEITMEFGGRFWNTAALVTDGHVYIANGSRLINQFNAFIYNSCGAMIETVVPGVLENAGKIVNFDGVLPSNIVNTTGIIQNIVCQELLFPWERPAQTN